MAMIDRDAEPTSNKSPYQPIDIRWPGRKRVIPLSDAVNEGGRGPDPAVYRFDHMTQCWVMKD